MAVKIRDQATLLTFVTQIHREFLIAKSSSTILDKIGNYTRESTVIEEKDENG